MPPQVEQHFQFDYRCYQVIKLSCTNHLHNHSLTEHLDIKTQFQPTVMTSPASYSPGMKHDSVQTNQNTPTISHLMVTVS